MRNKKVISIFSIILSFVLIICTSTAATAVEPRLSDTSSATLTLSFSGTTAYCVATVKGADGTSSISDGKLILTDSNGKEVASWINLSSNGKTLYVSKTAYGLTEGEKYTLTISAKVNRNGNTEKVSNSISKTC